MILCVARWFLFSLLISTCLSWPECLERCDGFCSSARNPNCETWGLNGDCTECEDGYFSVGPDTVCTECLSSIGCTDCEDTYGCISCNYGGTLEWDDVCGMNYCQDAGDEPLTVDSSASSIVTPIPTNTQTDSNTNTKDDTSDTSIMDNNNNNDNNITIINSNYAISKFDDNGIIGSVIVTRGNIFVYLNFSQFDFDSNWYDVNGEQCLKGGLYYSINEKWSYSSSLDKIGPSQCSISKTGSRWDPWMSCSTNSNNEYCKNYYDSSADGCVPPYSFNDDGNIYDELSYYCSEYTYANNPFSCEIGDLSGKYGRLIYDSETKTMTSHGSSPFEVDALDMTGKSILFRCGFDKSRALCGTFEEIEYPYGSEYVYEKHNTIISTITEKPIQNSTFSKIAYLTEDKTSYILLTYYHQYVININLRKLAIPGSCGTEIFYRIYNDGSDIVSSPTDCTNKIVGSFYDPTITCNEQSENEEKGFCSDYHLCDDASYSYECEDSGFYQSIDRYSCGPGDLSNKYGSIDISKTSQYTVNISGTDDLMIPLSLLNGKSVVLECGSNYQMIACGKFEDFTDDSDLYDGHIGDYIIGGNNNNNNDNNNNENESSNSTNSSFLGLSNSVSIVLLILILLTIIPCIRAIFKKKDYQIGQKRRNESSLAVVTGAAAGHTKISVGNTSMSNMDNSNVNSKNNNNNRRGNDNMRRIGSGSVSVDVGGIEMGSPRVRNVGNDNKIDNKIDNEIINNMYNIKNKKQNGSLSVRNNVKNEYDEAGGYSSGTGYPSGYDNDDTDQYGTSTGHASNHHNEIINNKHGQSRARSSRSRSRGANIAHGIAHGGTINNSDAQLIYLQSINPKNENVNSKYFKYHATPTDLIGQNTLSSQSNNYYNNEHGSKWRSKSSIHGARSVSHSRSQSGRQDQYIDDRYHDYQREKSPSSRFGQNNNNNIESKHRSYPSKVSANGY